MADEDDGVVEDGSVVESERAASEELDGSSEDAKEAVDLTERSPSKRGCLRDCHEAFLEDAADFLEDAAFSSSFISSSPSASTSMEVEVPSPLSASLFVDVDCENFRFKFARTFLGGRAEVVDEEEDDADGAADFPERRTDGAAFFARYYSE